MITNVFFLHVPKAEAVTLRIRGRGWAVGQLPLRGARSTAQGHVYGYFSAFARWQLRGRSMDPCDIHSKLLMVFKRRRTNNARWWEVCFFIMGQSWTGLMICPSRLALGVSDNPLPNSWKEIIPSHLSWSREKKTYWELHQYTTVAYYHIFHVLIEQTYHKQWWSHRLSHQLQK